MPKVAAFTRMQRYVLLIAVLGLLGTAARADDVPGIGDWEHYHFSLDEALVRVVFVHDVAGKLNFPLLTLPRSYIYFVNGAPPSTEGPLPERIETNHIGLAFSDPEGDPWSVAVQKYMSENAKSSTSAGKALRASQYTVELHPNTNSAWAESVRTSTAHNHSLIGEPYPGINEYSGAGSGSYFLGGEADECVQAYCYNPRNEVFFCKYSTMITKDIVAAIDFLDFRMHGGPDYANRRVRFAREVVCRFLDEC